jgi:hypothetical protein
VRRRERGARAIDLFGNDAVDLIGAVSVRQWSWGVRRGWRVRRPAEL